MPIHGSTVLFNSSKMAAQIGEGVTKEILKPGSGEMPKAGDTITVHCTGSLVNPPKKFWRLYGFFD